MRARFCGVAALAVLLGAAVAHSRPDLAVRHDGFGRKSGLLQIVVENLGAEASPATEIELRDRPFLGGLTGTSSHYAPVRGVEAVWIEQEPAEDPKPVPANVLRAEAGLKPGSRYRLKWKL